MMMLYLKQRKQKLHAVIEEIKKSYAKGQPVLVGTINIDASEEISALFERRREFLIKF